MINYLIFATSYALACVVQPGPFQAFLFSQSLTNGWRNTIPLVFAPVMSDIPIIILVLLVLTNVPHEVLSAIQCLGGLFLLYLAFKGYKTWLTFNQITEPNISYHQNFIKAVIVNLLNPGPYLGWSLVMGPLLIKGWIENPINGIILLIGFYCAMILFSTAMVVLFAAARNLGPRINRILTGISAIFLVFFGFFQLWSGIKIFL